MRINKIAYSGGMINNESEKQKLNKLVFNEDQIPKAINKIIEETKIYEIGGTYGDEKVGYPIQYDKLEIEYENKKTTIEAFNISIFMVYAEDPYIKRVFKVLVQFQIIAKQKK